MAENATDEPDHIAQVVEVRCVQQFQRRIVDFRVKQDPGGLGRVYVEIELEDHTVSTSQYPIELVDMAQVCHVITGGDMCIAFSINQPGVSSGG